MGGGDFSSLIRKKKSVKHNTNFFLCARLSSPFISIIMKFINVDLFQYFTFVFLLFFLYKFEQFTIAIFHQKYKYYTDLEISSLLSLLQ